MHISMEDFLKKYQQEKLNLIDIRSHSSYLKGSIQGAKNIPYALLKKFPSKYLEREKTYYIFCDEGYYSNELIEALKDNYNVIQIDGGYEAL